MKAHCYILLAFVCLSMPVSAATEANTSSEASLSAQINSLSDKSRNTADFEKKYKELTVRTHKSGTYEKMLPSLYYQKLMFYYYRHRLDSMAKYLQPLMDSYRARNIWKSYYFVQATMADAYTATGKISQSLDAGSKMLNEATRRHSNIGVAYGAYSLAIAYFTMNFHKKAIPYFEQAIPIFYKYKEWDTYVIATCNYLGSLTTERQYKKAQRILSKLDSLINVSNKSDEPFISVYVIPSVKGVIATQLYCYLRQPRMVRKYFLETVNFYRQHPDFDRTALLQAHLQYATASHNYQAQLAYADSLIRFYGDDIANSYRMYDFRSEAYEGMGNYKKALHELKRYNELRDSVYDKEALDQVARFSAEYGVDRLKVEKAELNLQLKEKQIHSFYLVIAIIVLLLVTIALVALYLLKANRRQKKMIAFKDEFIRSVSHEIRTPLNYIVGFSDVLTEMAPETDETKEMKSKIHQGSKELLKMFDDMILLSDEESGGWQIRLENVDIQNICSDVIGRVSDFITPATKIVFNKPDSPITVVADKNKLRYVIYNLLHNAAKFTESGTITVNIDGSVDGRCLISVSDTGQGIKDESIPLLFTSFFKEDKFSQGLGLGLVNSRNAVTAMGGTLSLNTDYVEGAEFDITLNIAD